MARFRPDAVVHLAAIATPFSRTDALTFRVNTQLAFNVCQAASRTRRRHASWWPAAPRSSATARPPAGRPPTCPIDEEHPVAPWNAYSLSKLVAEQTMATFARGLDSTRFAAVRPVLRGRPRGVGGRAHPVGPHRSPNGWTGRRSPGVSLFNYIDARDASDLVAALLERLPDLPNGEVFFAGAADALAREPLAERPAQVMPRHRGPSPPRL